VNDDAVAACQCRFPPGGPHNHAGRPGGGQLLLKSGVAEETQFDRGGGLQRCQAFDLPLGVAAKLTAERINNRAKSQCHTRACPYFAALSALITLSVMSCLGLMYTASWSTTSYFSASATCLTTRFARSSTCCSSSFLRAFRSSWNSRRLRWKSRSWSISAFWRCARWLSESVGDSRSNRSEAFLSAAPMSL